jgi:SAM-dependent methyltransferase
MTPLTSNIAFQATHHPLVFNDRFYSLAEYCLHLIHLRAYEEAGSLAGDKDVLDLGCNNGYGTALIAAAGGCAVGVDVSPVAIDDAQRRFGDCVKGFYVFDGGVIPFADDSFDMVVSFQVIEHISEPRPYLMEIARVLRADGIALLTTPNATIRLRPGMKPWNEFHVREYRATELADELKAVFAKVSIRGLFATQELYEIERDRCQAALRMAKARNVSPQQTSGLAALRQKGIDYIRKVLPPSALDHVRAWSTIGALRPVQKPLDPAVTARYSTQDFFYHDSNIDQALDLMAICKLS